jgi:hypothetical protein
MVRFHDTVDYNFNAVSTPSGTVSPTPPIPLAGIGSPGSTPGNSRDDQFSANLMYLTIYGVVSLYDAYEEKPAKK